MAVRAGLSLLHRKRAIRILTVSGIMYGKTHNPRVVMRPADPVPLLYTAMNQAVPNA